MSRLAPTNHASLPPERFGGYEVLNALNHGYLCVTEGGRRVVLKRLDADCLLHGQLHLSIKERLQRVRELAQRHVATLQTVERIDGSVYLVWEYVDGETFDDYAADPQRTAEQLVSISRELLLCIESLHAQGIIHGAIHGRNVIVNAASQIVLIHVSPLLYTEPAEDTEAAIGLLREVVQARAAEQTPLGEFVAEVDPRQTTLRQLAARLAGAGKTSRPEIVEVMEKPEMRQRRRAFWGAMAVIVFGIVIAAALYFAFAQHHRAPPSKFESLDTTSAGG